MRSKSLTRWMMTFAIGLALLAVAAPPGRRHRTR
jgi:hypothetical protein